MATKPTISSKGQGPQHFMPPTARELRAQSVHRLQIGLLGLAAMLLLIVLANIIMERAQQSDSAGTAVDKAAAVVSSGKKAESDPLAVIGVVPSPEANASSPAKAQNATH